jgi:hypothetical protein
MKHETISLNADLRAVWARLAKKYDAGVAQVGERLIRNQQAGASNASTSSMIEPG